MSRPTASQTVNLPARATRPLVIVISCYHYGNGTVRGDQEHHAAPGPRAGRAPPGRRRRRGPLGLRRAARGGRQADRAAPQGQALHQAARGEPRQAPAPPRGAARPGRRLVSSLDLGGLVLVASHTLDLDEEAVLALADLDAAESAPTSWWPGSRSGWFQSRRRHRQLGCCPRRSTDPATADSRVPPTMTSRPR